MIYKNNKPVPPDAEMAFSSTSHFQKSSLIFLQKLVFSAVNLFLPFFPLPNPKTGID